MGVWCSNRHINVPHSCATRFGLQKPSTGTSQDIWIVNEHTHRSKELPASQDDGAISQTASRSVECPMAPTTRATIVIQYHSFAHNNVLASPKVFYNCSISLFLAKDTCVTLASVFRPFGDFFEQASKVASLQKNSYLLEPNCKA